MYIYDTSIYIFNVCIFVYIFLQTQPPLELSPLSPTLISSSVTTDCIMHHTSEELLAIQERFVVLIDSALEKVILFVKLDSIF